MKIAALVAIGAGVAFFVILTVVLNRRYRRRMRAMAEERKGESICQFVRQLPYRQLDTKVIRRVYEAFEAEICVPDLKLPIRASDRIVETLEIDPEDLEWLIEDLAKACGRSLEAYEKNPHYPNVVTVADVVYFLCCQPKIAATPCN